MENVTVAKKGYWLLQVILNSNYFSRKKKFHIRVCFMKLKSNPFHTSKIDESLVSTKLYFKQEIISLYRGEKERVRIKFLHSLTEKGSNEVVCAYKLIFS